jgi:hypothetical protein
MFVFIMNGTGLPIIHFMLLTDLIKIYKNHVFYGSTKYNLVFFK